MDNIACKPDDNRNIQGAAVRQCDFAGPLLAPFRGEEGENSRLGPCSGGIGVTVSVGVSDGVSVSVSVGVLVGVNVSVGVGGVIVIVVVS
jgi:hypothetical protein